MWVRRARGSLFGMRSMRDERGQAAVSYGGILALLAVVFLALSALGLDGRVARAVEGAVCVITGGSDCEQPDGTTAGAEEPYEDTRPRRARGL